MRARFMPFCTSPMNSAPRTTLDSRPTPPLDWDFVHSTDPRIAEAEAAIAAMNAGAPELVSIYPYEVSAPEEDIFSGTDLWDFQANVEGSQAAIQALRPALQQRDAALVTTLDANFKAVFAAVNKYRSGDGFKPYQPTEAERKQLSTVVDALAEPVSKVAGVIAQK